MGYKRRRGKLEGPYVSGRILKKEKRLGKLEGLSSRGRTARAEQRDLEAQIKM